MANNVQIVLNSDGVRELLQSAEMLALCEAKAEEIAAEAGPGYHVSSFIGHDRAHATVWASSKSAQQDNLDNNTLLKAAGK